MSTTTAQFIETAANVSQILLVIGLYFGWKQLSIAVNDIKLRSRREAGMVAIEEAEKFAEEIIPTSYEISKKMGGLSGIQNKFEKFVPSEINPVNQQKYKERLEQITKDFDIHEKIIALANKIDSVAICFVKGIADEDVVFDTIGPVYCEIIEEFYFFYCHYRRSGEEKILLYKNSIILYCTWKKRIEKIGLETNRSELTKKKDDLDKEIWDATVKSSPIRPIGTF